MLDIITIPVLSDNYIYLLHESVTGETAVVDPAQAAPVMRILAKKGWRLDYIFNTHHHADHVGGNLQLKQQTGCKIIAAESDRQRIPGIDIGVNDGEQILLGERKIAILATPGHTSGHIVYYCAESQVLCCGDTLFSLGCGRLFEGSAEQMWQSLQKLKALPPATRLYCAHEYTQANGRFALTLEADNPTLMQRIAEVNALRKLNLPSLPSNIGLELATNPFLREHSPSIRKSLAIPEDASATRVFAEIRRLKDHFH
ncbi:MAG: hydroxyacylglutathione hydrolase [Methylococcales bacterium]|nr:hydroxyacylglutathione hydrolase [Methylococcales bacterium]